MFLFFLQSVIQDLYKRLQGNLQDLTIIFPNKRAGLFVNQYLSEITDKPLWAPQYTTISEFFSSLSDKKVPDTILLVAYLYKAYLSTGFLSPSKDSTFDSFYGWGEILLNDFQDIDNNLVDAKQLFSNISALETLNSLDYLEPEQIEAIRTYFTGFDPDDKNQLRQRFAEMWNSMNDIYTRFRNDLAADGLAYEAMLKREVIENLSTLTQVGEPTEPNLSTLNHTYAIVGFNVLNETEKQLFQYLKANADTYFYWDYDPHFIHDEAERFIKENILLFPNALPSTDSGQASHRPSIEIVGASTDCAQCSFANQWLRKHTANTVPEPAEGAEELKDNTNAVVLADENMLQTLLHTLPDCPINITMGYPLRQTAIASFVQALIDLQTRGFSKKGNGTMFHSYVTSVLRHPYTLQLAHKESVRIFKYMREHNTTYVHPSLFASSPVLSQIFTPVASHQTIISYLTNLIRQVGIINKHSDPLTVESIFTTYELLNTLADTLTLTPNLSPPTPVSEPVEPNLSPLTLSLITTLINSKTIAFHGEPADGLQVMGLLETRNLDFRNIIILSANEGMLPKTSHMPSFIPYFLRETHRLTTIEKQTSLYAYYFYRLLQRADHVALVYNNYTEGLKKGEKSRFLLQLQLDPSTIPSTSSGQALHQPSTITLHSPNTAMTAKVEHMEKTEAGLQKMLESLHYTLSPSALKTYIQCPLQFYFKYVARLREQDEISDDIEDSTFGTIIHEVMKELYQPYIGKDLTASILHAMNRNTTAIQTLVDRQFAINVFHEECPTPNPATWGGSAILTRDVIIRYIHSQLLHDASIAPIHIIALEADAQTDLGIPFLKHTINLGGRIDRIDTITIHGQTVTRIVDYKTSSHQQALSSIERLFTPDATPTDHIFQTFCYAEMLLSPQPPFPSLSPSLNYIKLLGKPDYQSIVTLPPQSRGEERQPILDYREQCHEEFHTRLIGLVNEITDTTKPFTHSPIDTPCRFCPFNWLCQSEK